MQAGSARDEHIRSCHGTGIPETALSNTSCGGAGGLEGAAGSGVALAPEAPSFFHCAMRRDATSTSFSSPIHSTLRPPVTSLPAAATWSSLSPLVPLLLLLLPPPLLLLSREESSLSLLRSLLDPSASPLPAVHRVVKFSPLTCQVLWLLLHLPRPRS